jgi:hypothetical protein
MSTPGKLITQRSYHALSAAIAGRRNGLKWRCNVSDAHACYGLLVSVVRRFTFMSCSRRASVAPNSAALKRTIPSECNLTAFLVLLQS